MKLLIVEDSLDLLHPVVFGLRQAGYEVDQATDGRRGLDLARQQAYDLIVLDIMLPKLDGLTLMRQLRAAGSAARVLLLTAKDTVEDRVAGLRDGADDYLVKPFAFDELLARIEALLRRGRELGDRQTRIGPITIDTAAKLVRRSDGDEVIPLTPREYGILEHLAMNRGRVVSRTELEQRVYDELAEPMSNVVDSAICVLRRKIDAGDAPSLIETRRGQGYIIPAETTP